MRTWITDLTRAGGLPAKERLGQGPGSRESGPFRWHFWGCCRLRAVYDACMDASSRPCLQGRIAVAVATLVIVAGAAYSQDSTGKKKGGGWKLPPSTQPAAPPAEPEATDPASDSERGNPTTVPPAQSSTGPLGDVARLCRLQSAQQGAAGPWNESVHIFLSDHSGITPAVRFAACSAPSFVAGSDGSIQLFMMQHPLDNELNFGSFVWTRGTDAGTNWTYIQRVAIDGMPTTVEGPLHPSVIALPDGRLRLAFVGRDHSGSSTKTMLFIASSADGGSSFAVDSARLDLGDADIEDLSAVQMDAITHIFATIKGREGLLHAVAPGGSAPLEQKADARFKEPVARRGGCRFDGTTVEYVSGAGGSALCRAISSGQLGTWKLEPIDPSAPQTFPPDQPALDISRTTIASANGPSLMVSAVVLSESQAGAAPTTPAAGEPGTPIASEEGNSQEAAPSARRRSDPVAAPKGLEVQPFGKKQTPTQTTPGPGNGPGFAP